MVEVLLVAFVAPLVIVTCWATWKCVTVAN